MRKTITLTVPTISCSSCTAAIEKTLNQQESIINVQTYPYKKAVVVVCEDIAAKDIEGWLDDIGHEVGDYDEKALTEYYLKRAAASALLGLPLLLISALSITVSLPLMAIFGLSSLAVTYYAGADIFTHAYKQFKKSRSLSVDTLFSLSTGIALTVSLLAFVVPVFSFEFSTALLIFASRHLGKYIEARMQQRVQRGLRLNERLPRIANRISSIAPNFAMKRFHPVDANDIQVGDYLLVSEGEAIPCDGRLVKGNGLMLRTIISGQLIPEDINNHSKLYAGMTIESGYVIVQATSTQTDSHLNEVDRVIEETTKEKSPTELRTERLISYFIPTVLILATIASAIALPLAGGSIALHTGLSLLVGACPCTLGFIVPLAINISLRKAAETGAIINSPKAIETAGEIETVIFDLNGTLTEGLPEIRKTQIHTDMMTEQAIYNIVFHLESALTKRNIFATKLLEYSSIHRGNTQTSLSVSAVSQNNTPGFSALINDERYIIGNSSMMKEHNIDVNHNPHEIYLVKDKQLLATFTMKDQLRKDAQQTIETLFSQGKTVKICTGASFDTAVEYAYELGLSADEVIADCTGAKAKQNALRQEKNAAFVGDAVNDLTALKKAALGIAVNNADVLSKQYADVVIQDNSLLPIPALFSLGKQTTAIIRQNLTISFVYNITVAFLCCGFAASIGMMAPGAMAVCMSIQSLLVLLNTARLKTATLSKPTSTPLSEDDGLTQSQVLIEPHTPRFCPTPTFFNSPIVSSSDDNGEVNDPLPNFKA